MLLHYVLQHRLPISTDIIFFIVDFYPDAATMKNAMGLLPLHIACWYHCVYEIIIKLLDIYPEAIKRSSYINRFPMHYSLLCYHVDVNQHVDTIFLLIDRCHEAVAMKDQEGCLPLHTECWNQCRHDIILKLLTIYPEAARLVNGDGRLPLHLTLLSNHDIGSYPHYTATIRLIMNHYPAAIRYACSAGGDTLPFHVLFKLYQRHYRNATARIRSSCVRNVAQELLNHYPQALYLPSSSPFIDTPAIQQYSVTHRLLLNLACHHLPSLSTYMHDYHDMNWKSRTPLLHLLLLPTSYHHIKSTRDAQQELKSSTVVVLADSAYDGLASIDVLLHMMIVAGRMKEEGIDTSMSYGWMRGDDLGCVLLRNIVLYL